MKKPSPPLKVGCIGAGSSGCGHILLLERFEPGCVVAFCDRDRHLFDEIIGSAVRGRQSRAAGDFATDVTALRKGLLDIPFYTDPDEMLDREDVNTVVISTWCSSHCEMVARCVKRGVNILLEKPIAITEADVEHCWQLLRNYPKVATVNFTMRGAPVTLAAQRHVRNGTIGKIVSVQYVNNVHYGDGYFRKWMRTRKNIGSLLLQKATHDFDIINTIVGLRPVSMAAFGSRLVYGGDQPNDLTCDACGKKWTCPMSIHKLHLDAAKPLPPPHVRKCVYAREIDIEDNHVVIIQYERGVTASYSQTFNAPPQGGQRGGCFVGTEGIMNLMYYGEFEETPAGQMLRGNSQIDITRYHQKPSSRIHEVYDWAGRNHFDGTEYVMLAKLEFLRGTPNEAAGTIREGYISAKMCLAAQKSMETGTVMKLELDL
ncbi:MAG: Gfo/Idh/MocA family oxidoreductase [Verrucomicrobia bacterium]|nr:Gfo/Idh/MocA family oxidoreductase [Verrucomicrobiota bacterium]